jgi:hypothetical protein
MIFQGQELLEDEHFTDTDPLDWSKKERFADVFALYRDLIALRKTHDGLKRAPVEITHQNDGAKVLAYTRGDRALVVLNLSSTDFTEYTLGAPSAGAWSALWTAGGPEIVEAPRAAPRSLKPPRSPTTGSRRPSRHRSRPTGRWSSRADYSERQKVP